MTPHERLMPLAIRLFVDRFIHILTRKKPRKLCNTGSLLTLNVRGLIYLGLTRSISWLLMPWLLTSPGHQQPWYWLWRICPGFTWGMILSTCVIWRWSNDMKCKYMFMFPLQNVACKEFREYGNWGIPHSRSQWRGKRLYAMMSSSYTLAHDS